MSSVSDVSTFKNDPSAFAPINVTLVVKDLDLLGRRKRLSERALASFYQHREDRPVERGLVVNATLRPGGLIKQNRVLSVDEARGHSCLPEGDELVTENNTVLWLNNLGHAVCEFKHPLLLLAHNITLHPDGRRFLVTATGNSALLEFDLFTGECVWEWVSWEHGWNPNADGIFQTRDKREYWRLMRERKPALYLEPGAPDCTGTLVSARVPSPNSSCYNGENILATMGRDGRVIEIDRYTGGWREVISGLHVMPHGILPCGDGWLVSDTQGGAVFQFAKDFAPTRCVLLRNLPKVAGAGDHEWIQHAYPVTEDYLLVVDSHRGIVMIDVQKRAYALCTPEDEWSVHSIEPIRPV